MAQASLGVASNRTIRSENKAASDWVAGRGIAVDATFCPPEVADPFETVQWDLRTAAIKGENGEVLFEQTNCEIPATWSQLATNVVVSKYFYGEVNTPER